MPEVVCIRLRKPRPEPAPAEPPHFATDPIGALLGLTQQGMRNLGTLGGLFGFDGLSPEPEPRPAEPFCQANDVIVIDTDVRAKISGRSTKLETEYRGREDETPLGVFYAQSIMALIVPESAAMLCKCEAMATVLPSGSNSAAIKAFEAGWTMVQRTIA